MREIKFNRFEKSKRVLLLVIASIIFSIGFATKPKQYKKHIVKSANVANCIYKKNKDSIKRELIDEVSNYISLTSGNKNEQIPKYIVEVGLKNKVNIVFMMSQAQIETNFGKCGVGNSNKSIFGFQSCKYNNYGNSVEHYVDVLKTNYLVNGKTEKHLLNNYVNKNGYKYAKSKNYEKKLKEAYLVIKKKTKIYNLQQEYNKIM